ncbi:hypothetical protein F53441_10498 [Fusarium austroafricanum]|uniref:NACHT domain-containing protein n=1 Tax=Fusarium austroafricanum TaxID=2364996 RepID=A0A8H4KB38_9HYPO|nr:hypothetical protein F53441_10498 [Fusarium austroafricanum]
MAQHQILGAQSLTQRPSKANVTEAVTELETAVASFQARLSDGERTRLQGLKSTPHDIQAVIMFTAELDRTDPKRRGKSLGTRVSSFLQTIQQFFPAIDVFVSSNPELAALIWGSILSNFTSYFESFVELLHGFGNIYSRFNEYQLLYETSARLKDSICRFNSAVIACCEQLVVVASRGMMVQAAKALTTSFQSEMRQYIDAIKAKADDVQRDIELAKAKSDHHEQKLQAKERAEASDNRSLVVASFSKHWNQLSRVRRDVNKAAAARKQRRALDALSKYNRYIANLNSARNKRYLRTADWVFDAEAFKDWRALQELPVLHITGKIGSGKTVLSSRIIEHINDTKSESDAVSFFFCRFDDSDSLDCDTILRSLAYQLISSPSLAKIIESAGIYNDLDSAEDQSYSKDSLKKLFRHSSKLVRTWFIILDGIDETTADQRQLLFEFLSEVVTHKETLGKVKLLLSCRETLNQDITTWFSDPPHVVAGSKQTSQDILIYAEDVLYQKLAKNELVLDDINLAGEILLSIAAKEQGMFLWVFLSIEDICSRKSDRDIREALETLPSDLNVTLDRALERIHRHNNQKIAQAIFRWTAVVRQPLTVGQLREALSVEVGAKVLDPKSRINGIERLTQWCENLVRIEPDDDTVCFSHHSIHHYLSQPDSSPWKDFHIDYEQADHHVGQVCLTYLNLETPSPALTQRRDERPRDPFQIPATNFPITAIAQQTAREAMPGSAGVRVSNFMNRAIKLREKPQPLQQHGSQPLVELQFPLTSHFPFLQYAEKHWHVHIRFLASQSETYLLLREMLCIISYISEGIPHWPAHIEYSPTICDCSNILKRSGIHEDLDQVLASGYQRSSDPLLQIFIMIYNGTLTSTNLDWLCQEHNLTGLGLLRARTLAGKSILDLLVGNENHDFEIPYYMLIRKFVDGDFIGYIPSIGLGPDELHLLLTNGLHSANRALNHGYTSSLLKIIDDLALSKAARASYNESIFSDAEQVIQEQANAKIVSEGSVNLYLQFAERLSYPKMHSLASSFEQAIDAMNFGLAKLLADGRFNLGNCLSNNYTRVFYSIMICGLCKVKCSEETTWTLTLCEEHRGRLFEIESSDDALPMHSHTEGWRNFMAKLSTNGSESVYLATRNY